MIEVARLLKGDAGGVAAAGLDGDMLVANYQAPAAARVDLRSIPSIKRKVFLGLS